MYNLGTAYLSNVTMTNNYSDYDFSETGDGGGIAGTGTTYLKNSVLMNIDRSVINQYPNIHGNVLSANYNIIANIGDANNFTPADHDIVGDSTNPIDPELGVNIYSSGSHQLLSTSLVLDQIPVQSCTYLSGGSNPLFTDGEVITAGSARCPKTKQHVLRYWHA